MVVVFDEQITFHAPGASLISGEYRGHQEIVGFFRRLAELSAATLNIEAHEVFGNGTRTVVALATIDATRNGREGRFASG